MFVIKYCFLNLHVYSHRSRESLVKGDIEQKHKTYDLNIDTNEQGTAIILINKHTCFILLEYIFSHFTDCILLPYPRDSFLSP